LLTKQEQNTATGINALSKNTAATDNTATGGSALFTNTTGSFNTADGFQALYNNSTGSYNIAVGRNAGVKLTTGNNNIEIGNIGGPAEAGTIRIGTTGTQTATYIAGIRGTTTSNANAVPVVSDSAGQLGTISSSRRFKEDVKPMRNSSDSILALEPVTFRYKTDTQGTPQFGLIAEEVAKVNPDLVVHDGNGEIYSVRCDAVNAMLLNEFLKERHRAEEQRKQFETKFAQQQKQIEALTATVQK
jgi:hypothetical protein